MSEMNLLFEIMNELKEIRRKVEAIEAQQKLDCSYESSFIDDDDTVEIEQ